MNSDDIKKQLAKLRRDKRLLWLGILFFVMVVFWILASIFATSKTSSVSPELRELAKSFVPRLESKIFEEIASKRSFSDGELSSFPIYVFDKKTTDGAAESMVDIIAPSIEPSSKLPARVEVSSESATQVSEENVQASGSADQTTQPLDQGADQNSSASSPASN